MIVRSCMSKFVASREAGADEIGEVWTKLTTVL